MTRTERLIPLKIKAPSISGREMYNKIECLIWDEKSRSIYGGTTADGILFRFYPKEEKIISLGKPLNQPHIRCLVKGEDNCIYGIAGKDCCHLFVYYPQDIPHFVRANSKSPFGKGGNLWRCLRRPL